MYLTDYHTHSCCSPDSTARLEDMVRAARRAGLRELCTTDHCDLQDENGAPLGGWDWTPILDQYWRARDKGGSEVKVLLGLELGGAYTDPGRAEALVAAAPLDFVIGSIHNLSPEAGGRDFFYLDYRSEEACYTTLDDYFASMLALTRLDCYDALGHIIYPLRYMNGRAGWHITLDRYGEQLDQLLRAVIQNGKAIEVNTHGGREVEDWRPILRHYHQLGGELVTTGSDAHSPGNVGRGISQAVALLRETGFHRFAVYRKRRPEWIKL
ncbi:histidinol-phosphatase HisJ family protein [Muriventricola aceti]|uniref:histidinol-phosphatase HisJ family protein n=1 Tax=Muriventricola aceti TaxID=2981773 RepID=UPI0008224DF9|nr:histidinol-phosphatase HisJ family protein [Muriventricola aceti]MCU6703288.1 histidinol-phosphatase HisJ family protein [Muriventricola aceti]SCJ42248.1 histidinol-phosphatase [uncultured Flavonifractor sp.]